MADASPLSLNVQKLDVLQRDHPQIDDLSVAAEFLCVLMAGRFLASGKPIDDEVVSVSACKSLLSTESALYEELRQAHASGTLADFADSALLPPLSWLRRNTNPLQEDTIRFLESLRLCRSFTDELSIILHRLGHFADDEVLRKRVEHIFTPQNKFMVNASGTGKTRLCYEGLCQNWGLYLSFAIDDGRLGSLEIQMLLKGVRDEYVGQDPASVDFQSMDERIEVLFGAVLLARLLLFVAFLETAQIDSDGRGFSDEHKKQWLAMQLQPHSIANDPFEALTRILLDNDEAYLEHNIAAAFRKVRRIVGEQQLFLVLDESSTAVGMFSELLPRDSRSILQMALDALLRFLDDNCTIISAGIDIPKSHFSEGAGSDFGWTSETGAFDDPATQEAYVTQFLPPDFRDSDAGRFLIARVWHWLRGRCEVFCCTYP
uniref:Uncharacterized protein n=1 Tax=Mycena chlorophos TaxID=658473 RepID=A0ABQ0KZU1_MYCCL|nr:predicted protein [Mycena chlorophos]